MYQIPIKMLKQHAIPNSSLQNLKIYSLEKLLCKEGAEQLLCSYAANTAILKLRIFSGRYHFRLWVFVSTGEYFHY